MVTVLLLLLLLVLLSLFSLLFSFFFLLFSHTVASFLMWPLELQHARPPCPSQTPRVCSDSCPSSRWCHPTISSSAVPVSSCPQSFPASGSFPMSWLLLQMATVLEFQHQFFQWMFFLLIFLLFWFFFVVVAIVAILGTVQRDVGLIPGTGRSPGEGNGNLLQYSCLGNPMDRGAWRTIVHGVEKNWVWLNDWACMQKIRNQDSHDPCFSVLWWLHDGQEFFDSEILNLGCLWFLWAVVIPCRCTGSWSGYNRVSQTVNPNNRHVLPGD